MNKIRRIDEVKVFLKELHPEGIQMFNSRNIMGDPMYTIYDKDGIMIDECSCYNYIEIFGVTEEEYNELVESCGCGDGMDGDYEKDRWHRNLKEGWDAPYKTESEDKE